MKSKSSRCGSHCWVAAAEVVTVVTDVGRGFSAAIAQHPTATGPSASTIATRLSSGPIATSADHTVATAVSVVGPLVVVVGEIELNVNSSNDETARFACPVTTASFNAEVSLSAASAEAISEYPSTTYSNLNREHFVHHCSKYRVGVTAGGFAAKFVIAGAGRYCCFKPRCVVDCPPFMLLDCSRLAQFYHHVSRIATNWSAHGGFQIPPLGDHSSLEATLRTFDLVDSALVSGNPEWLAGHG